MARVEAEKLRDELARVREELGQLREEARSWPGRCGRPRPASARPPSCWPPSAAGPPGPAPTRTPSSAGRGPGWPRPRPPPGWPGASAKEARSVDDARLWLLLETIGQAAVGLRRELALDPADKLPADFVADAFAEQPGTAPAGPAARARDTDDPARLDQLLALPRAHLVVDGYNVTKRGFGEMSLEQQRNRLITGLGGLAAQTGDEVTVRLRRRRADARAAARAARRTGALLPQGRDRRRADPATGPCRAGRAARWWWSPPTARSPTGYAGTAPTRWAPTRCYGGSPAPE